MDQKIKSHFKKVDPTLYQLLVGVGEITPYSPQPSHTFFNDLCSNIISQQLSSRVADVIWGRFQRLFPRKQVTPQHLLGLSDTTIRSIGISNSKIGYLKDLAKYHIDQLIQFDQLDKLSDEQVIKELTKIKGIGNWTAEMFLMFTLGRPDIFSPGDQGLKNAIKKHYQKAPDPSVWSPYRTFACLILWKSLEL